MSFISLVAIGTFLKNPEKTGPDIDCAQERAIHWASSTRAATPQRHNSAFEKQARAVWMDAQFDPSRPVSSANPMFSDSQLAIINAWSSKHGSRTQIALKDGFPVQRPFDHVSSYVTYDTSTLARLAPADDFALAELAHRWVSSGDLAEALPVIREAGVRAIAQPLKDLAEFYVRRGKQRARSSAGSDSVRKDFVEGLAWKWAMHRIFLENPPGLRDDSNLIRYVSDEQLDAILARATERGDLIFEGLLAERHSRGLDAYPKDLPALIEELWRSS
ncbi:MAG: hypothetical protein AAF918_16080 [Pseudomonadota bacterium]